MADPPLTQGPAPLLNRAWARRGWAAPPFFGRSVPGIMMESTVTIERRAIADNGIGGFRGSGGWVVVYAGPAHVEHFEEQKVALADTETVPILGVTTYHHYEVYMPIPEDPAQVPRKGDRVRFNDGYDVHEHPVMHVEMNSGLTDHLELWTDEFEV